MTPIKHSEKLRIENYKIENYILIKDILIIKKSIICVFIK